VERFVKINSEMRRANNKTLSDLRFKTADRFLWSKPFIRQPHSQAEANFADVRNYVYHGQKIDQQVHLGYDLAVTQHVGVEASNDGKVLYAASLGIYGNCIVLDHGYGLQTIYGHLSRIDVHDGDAVKQGQVMGLSGQTGMAGGDHIHFAMQLDGVQIDPKEWWDQHWIKDHITRRVDLREFNPTVTGTCGSSAKCGPPESPHSLQAEDPFQLTIRNVSEDFADYIEDWKHNGYWLFNSPQIIRTAAKEHSVDIEGTSRFYYEAYELEFDEGSWHPYGPEQRHR